MTLKLLEIAKILPYIYMTLLQSSIHKVINLSISVNQLSLVVYRFYCMVLYHSQIRNHMITSLPTALCMLGNFSWFFVVCYCFFYINFLEKFFQENHQDSKQFGSRSGPTKSWAWSGSKNCLQRLDNKICGLQEKSYHNTSLLLIISFTLNPYPATIFCPENIICFISSSAHQPRYLQYRLCKNISRWERADDNSRDWQAKG